MGHWSVFLIWPDMLMDCLIYVESIQDSFTDQFFCNFCWYFLQEKSLPLSVDQADLVIGNLIVY